ncbi:MarR family transcriptional regulator [Sulfolobus sp. A20]|uniref:ABC transporter ATP-binding protein n=1 Tax=Sulfolobaceae TaxID=118883 RepID=UPI0008460E80|nr:MULTISPECIES: ABC transporter ATP-binding protein [unclassified Sulfolobus]TRM76090.1 ABC transporter ATP-binding protein [Sulfolobus sp. A20-N-F8]TRM76305.1 ABC transporter ATP-binding protein [Sulfolobus sp. E5]TRM80968.1 ABC transporter ATP-binding protein [Sulfolobus sp. D5]TRM84020.1 ABC transporter ATP-binding protein [Sulfolobus sp. A20-N-F6]TRM88565.1 ABC transporter ATP-binding protein [Sulfolobus sp. C3]TRM89131.1 ABC transporter ATP-binding protein [Sulfolobus sp. E3]TRM94801.1
MKVIDIKGVWKLYGKLIANENISMSVEEGEIVSLLGPNGAGKTTLVKQIYGELTPSKGEIKVLGKKPSDRNVKKLIGVVPQECEPYGDLTVWDNIYYMGKLKGVDKEVIKNRGEELLDKLDLKDKRNTLARDLSGGLKRRTLIAMALINDPKLLILDEPTTGLDPEARREVWDILLKMKKEGRSMLLTTHYLEEAERLADKIYFLSRKIIAEGTPSQIKEKFAEWYEVIDYSTGKTYKVRGEEELKSLILKLNGKFEVRMPSLEEIYLQVIKNAE